MAIQLFECPACGEFELHRSIHNNEIPTCPDCGVDAKRLIHPAGGSFFNRGPSGGWFGKHGKLVQRNYKPERK